MKKQRTQLLRSLTVCVMLLSLFLGGAYAQGSGSHVIQGTVSNEKGEPMAGVVVAIKGSTTATQTDAKGAFKLNAPKKGTMVFTHTGYADKSIDFNESTSNVSLSLEISASGLDEVVVVGYNTVKKKDLTGAVSGINQKDIRSRPVNNAVQAMQGKVAGVDITSNERPGQVGSINIRGVRSLSASNSPLFVVDGIPLITGSIDNLNPGDIETIDVLKDASATAIYGSRGANGVVIITTKQGKAGKTTISFNHSMTFENLQDNMTMFNASEYIDYRRWAVYYQNLNTTTGISSKPRGDQPTQANDNSIFTASADPSAWANINKGWASGTWDGSKVATTDWRGIVMQQAVTSDNVVSVSGGSDKVKAYASFGYLHNNGTIKGQSFERYTAKVNVDIAATPWLSLGSSINVNYNNQQYGQSSNGVATIGSPRGGLYESARSIFPYAVPYDANGARILFPGADQAVKSVIDEWNYNIDQRVTLRTFGSMYSQVNFGNIHPILKGLKYRMNFGPDISSYRDGIYIDAQSVANGGSTSFASLINNRTFSYTLDHLLYYDKSIGEHTFGATLLASKTAYNMETSTINGSGIPMTSQRWNALTSGTVTGTLSTASDLVEQQLMSSMARFNYGYKDKYLLTASARQDGASQLAPGHKYSWFPSAALAWRISKEKFMDNITFVNDLKLRLGAGVTGNSAIKPYQTLGGSVALFYPFVGSNTAGAMPSSIFANTNVGWEKTTQYNLGMDFQVLNSKVSGSVDVYKSRTTDLLMQRNIPTVTGYTSVFDNIGQTANQGIDINLTTVNLKRGDLSWTTNINASWQKEHIVSLANGKQNDIANNWFINQPIGVVYGYEKVGIWQKGDSATYKLFNANGNAFFPGNVRVKDLNGDNKIDPNNDRKIVGTTRPKWIVGMTNTFSYKGFELSFFLYGRLKYIYNDGGEVQAARSVNRKISYYNENNLNADYQKPIYNAGGAAGDAYYSALGILEGSFIKLRNVSLGYTFSNKLIASKGLSNLKAYMQIQNLGMLYSNIKHLEMDVQGPTWNRGVTVGINASF